MNARVFAAAAALAFSIGRAQDAVALLCDSYVDGNCIVSSDKLLNCTAVATNATNSTNGTLSLQPRQQQLPNGTCLFEFASLIITPGVVVTCVTPELCTLNLTVNNSATLGEASRIVASTISITAAALEVESGAAISSDGLGWLGGPGSPVSPGGGGSAAGTGGVLPCVFSDDDTPIGDTDSCCDGYSVILTFPNGLGSFSSPLSYWDTFGAGSGGGGLNASVSGRGGGRIHIAVSGAFSLDGVISANGAAPTGVNATLGAGAGGTIVVSAASLSGNGLVSSSGGPPSAVGLFAGGGGGRIALNVPTLDFELGSLQALGGGFGSGGPPDGLVDAPCFGGSGGTVYISQRVDSIPAARRQHSPGAIVFSRADRTTGADPFSGSSPRSAAADAAAAAAADNNTYYIQLLIANNNQAGLLAATPISIPYYSLTPSNSSSGAFCGGPDPDDCAAVDSLFITDSALVSADFINLRSPYGYIVGFVGMSLSAGAVIVPQGGGSMGGQHPIQHQQLAHDSRGAVVQRRDEAEQQRALSNGDSDFTSTAAAAVADYSRFRSSSFSSAASRRGAQRTRSSMHPRGNGWGSSRFPPRGPLSPNITILASNVLVNNARLTSGSVAVVLDTGSFEIRGASGISFAGIVSVRSDAEIYIDAELRPPTSGIQDEEDDGGGSFKLPIGPDIWGVTMHQWESGQRTPAITESRNVHIFNTDAAEEEDTVEGPIQRQKHVIKALTMQQQRQEHRYRAAAAGGGLAANVSWSLIKERRASARLRTLDAVPAESARSHLMHTRRRRRRAAVAAASASAQSHWRATVGWGDIPPISEVALRAGTEAFLESTAIVQAGVLHVYSDINITILGLVENKVRLVLRAASVQNTEHANLGSWRTM